jgi:hypothetical protein
MKLPAALLILTALFTGAIGGEAISRGHWGVVAFCFFWSAVYAFAGADLWVLGRKLQISRGSR